MDTNDNQMYDIGEPMGLAINQETLPGTALVVDGSDYTGADITLVEPCTPEATMKKTVWRDFGEFGDWDEYTEVEIGETVRFNITIEIPETGCAMTNGYLYDYLPIELEYVEYSTEIRFFYDGQLYEYLYGDDCNPTIVPNYDTNILQWTSQNGYGEYIPPNSIIYFEFEAEVINCGEFTNTANATGYYTCCDYIQVQDTAQVWVYCEQNNPPNPPTDQFPGDGATGIYVDANPVWYSSDPDGDAITYDVYFGDTNTPPLVSPGQSSNVYEPGTMNYCTTYYWQIVVWDEHGASTAGPLWSFTTEMPIINK